MVDWRLEIDFCRRCPVAGCPGAGGRGWTQMGRQAVFHRLPLLFYRVCRLPFTVYRPPSTVYQYYWQLELRGVKEAL